MLSATTDAMGTSQNTEGMFVIKKDGCLCFGYVFCGISLQSYDYFAKKVYLCTKFLGMTLHIFNPEHDIALAANLSNFTAPHAGRQLRHDFGFLPALWAEEGDRVLVDDVEHASKRMAKLLPKLPGFTPSRSGAQLTCLCEKVSDFRGKHDRVEPWGWDAALRAQLLRKGVPEAAMPNQQQLNLVRDLSHRRVAARMLRQLQGDGLMGESFECTTVTEIEPLLGRYNRLVLKAPWSSSGRGLRFLDSERTPLSMQAGWLKNILAAQGSVMAEPYYNKVKDLGMEFHSDGKGGAAYLGLSLFHTMNGAYTGNILATESAKEQLLSRYVQPAMLHELSQHICQLAGELFRGQYEGPFGVDMMLCVGDRGTGGQLFLHPCVEINLRRTMGHVALELSKLVNPTADDELVRVMRIVYEDNHYKLKIQRL